MIIASAGALLATSDVKPPLYNFEASESGPRASLSASKPKARYLVRARVNALGPDGTDSTGSARSTGSAQAIVHGTISASAGAYAVANGSPFVNVRFGAPQQTAGGLSALTSFQLSAPLAFTGDCAQLAPDEGAPCQAELELSLELAQPSALTADGHLSVDWSVDLQATAAQPDGKGPDETVAAPWTVEIVEQ